MELDAGERTLTNQIGNAVDLKTMEEKREFSVCEEVRKDRIPYSEIPRVELKKRMQVSKNHLHECISTDRKKLREIEEFEKTFSSMSEAIQDGMAPALLQRWLY